MATETHGVEPSHVIHRTPMARGSVTMDSAGVTLGDLEHWIATASGIVNSILRSKTRDPTELEDDETLVVTNAIEAYAEWKLLRAREYDDLAADARDEWKETLDAIRELPEMMEGDQSHRKIKHSSSDLDPQWDSDNFGGW